MRWLGGWVEMVSGDSREEVEEASGSRGYRGYPDRIRVRMAIWQSIASSYA